MGPVAAEDIVAATGRHDTPTVVGTRPVRELWRFSREDVGRVSVVINYPEWDRNGPIVELFPGWLKWIQGTTEAAKNDADAHRFFLAQLSTSGRFDKVPVIQDESIRIHDGRHRLLAAYDPALSGCRVFPLEVYWIHPWPDGVLRHIPASR